jgi:3',5'-cyclic-AMP phosphodiesterase
MKLIHITDTHLISPGRELYGLDPMARLSAAIADINAHHSDADLAVITGDLTHWGEAEAYAAFLACMSKLRIPYVPMVGNHDRRVSCLDVLKSAPRDPNGFVQGWKDTRHGRLVFLDTLDETTHAGQMCEQRLGWLAETLSSTPDNMRLFLFMHHPPFAVGIHEMDKIALVDSDRFLKVVKPHAWRIRHLFFGHVHRPINGSWAGIPFSTLRGTNHQVSFDLTPDGPHLATHEPPAYGIVLVGDQTVVVHTHDFLDQSARYPFSKAGVDDRAYALGPFN